MKKAVYVNHDMLEPYDCGPTYASTMLLGDELTGEPCINVNWGQVKPRQRLGGSAHDKAEIYLVFRCHEGAEVVTGQGADEVHYKVKAGDLIYIPGGVFHYIDNSMNDEEFIIMTFWPHQSQNDMFDVRQAAWGTCFKFINK